MIKFKSVDEFLKILYNKANFKNSKKYWINRYKEEGNSGVGSYNNLAKFKAEILNEFSEKNKINSVIEFGCGDGNQLHLFNFNLYTGYDISPDVIDKCRNEYKNDKTKDFYLLNQNNNTKAELTLSLDVIYHLIEDKVFAEHMNLLFNASNKYVIIYSSNSYEYNPIVPHVKHREFTIWVEKNIAGFKLVNTVPNIFPFKKGNPNTSKCDFFIYKKEE